MCAVLVSVKFDVKKKLMQEELDKNFDQVIQGCCRQNRNSQNNLYRLFYPYGMSICIRYVDSEARAVSLLNEGFLKVFRNINQYGPERPFKPWFRKILVNTAINHIKKQKKFKQEVAMDEAKNVHQDEDALSQIAYQELMSMVKSLSTAYRTVFNLYVIDGFKHHEISSKLGISVATSKSNLSRARAKLRELLTDRYLSDNTMNKDA